MSSFIAFRSAAISLLRRPHTRPFASQQPPAPPKTKSNVKTAQGAKASSEAQKNKGPFRDSDIPHRFVRLVDPETGKLTNLQPLRPILSKIDPRSHYLELVTENPEPIVKIFNRYDEITRAAEAAHRAREVARQNIHKEVQLSWASAPADFAHKINKVREDLLRGARVDVVFVRKSGQSKLQPAVMHERASEAIESLLDVSKEWKERDVRPGQGLLAVFLEGTATADVAADPADTNSQPEVPNQLGKKFAVFSDSTPTDLNHVVRRMSKELAKGTRVELVVSAKAGTPTNEPDEPLTVDELHARAQKLMKLLKGEAKEWREREYKPVSAKLSVFLEKDGAPTKGKVVVHKGPKPKKIKPDDIPDLFQD